ncbi:Piso0_001684 [Millerozyma farinosa CBS 7064]|uniref:Piso0_001684 protein n=1 Tax=Pichia sorbitophila (strain ATCC MYA-4447 / BCRC 22081 / CBS 7064 / NBRC 10061 / NRRL Y-12695) TaxID=559304 RepID=G8YNT9_PICSO|nr:Piso0_001684 [Millerozyma farinosa CBS 7064]
MHMVHEFHGLSNKYDVLVLGAKGVGKSSLIVRYIQQQFVEDPEELAEEGSYRKAIEVDGKYGALTIQDTDSSKDIYSTSRQLLIQNARSVVFVYSVTDAHSFEMAEDLVHRTQAVGHKVPFVLVGAKWDLADEHQVTYDEGESLARRLGAMRFFECSSKTSEGVDEVFGSLIPIYSRGASEQEPNRLAILGPEQRTTPCLESEVSDQDSAADRQTEQASQQEQTNSEHPRSPEKEVSKEPSKNQGARSPPPEHVEARRSTIEDPALESASSKACCIIV